ncbi:MAG: alanine racemase [Rhodoglobus sp.]|nr:alanine racemase [Rhodoglobus sp.]
MDSRGWLDLDLETPALLIDRPTLLRNLDEMAGLARSHGVDLLPHAKTHRMTELGRLQLERGAGGLCVAKLGEAEKFAAAGVARIFVAFPIAGVSKARRALALDRGCYLTLGTDSVEGAETIGAVFAAASRTARLMLAIDSGLGREGVTPALAPQVAERIATLPGVELHGIFTHEGSVYGAEDADDRDRRAVAAGKLMVDVATEIRLRGIPLAEVSLGSSASARAVMAVDGVTQIRPGIYAVNDFGQIVLGNATLETTAIRVVATVVSHPEPTRAAIDAGSKALSTDLLPATAHRAEHPALGLLVDAPGWAIERMSEEHGWLRWTGSGEPSALPVGTRLEIVPNHACMAFFSLRRATVIEGGAIVEVWEGMGPGASE